MTSLTRTESLENLSKNLCYILLEKNLVKLQAVSALDSFLFLLLTTVSCVYLSPLCILSGLAILGARRKNTCLLNTNFVLGVSSIPLRIILMLYYKKITTTIVGFLSIVSVGVEIWYTWQTLSLLTNKPDGLELTVQRTVQIHIL